MSKKVDFDNPLAVARFILKRNEKRLRDLIKNKDKLSERKFILENNKFIRRIKDNKEELAEELAKSKVKIPVSKLHTKFTKQKIIRKSKSKFVKKVKGTVKNLNKLLKELRKKGGMFRIQVLDGNVVKRSTDITFPKDNIQNIKWDFLLNSKEFIFKKMKDPVLRVTKIKKVRAVPLTQTKFKDGTIGNCLFVGMIEQINQKLIKSRSKRNLINLLNYCEFASNYFEKSYVKISKIQDICDTFNINIRIKDVLGEVMYHFKRCNRVRCLMEFTFINSRDKHIIIESRKKKHFELDDLNVKYDELKDTHFIYTDFMGKITSINTPTEKYNLSKTKFAISKKEFYETYSDCMTPRDDYIPLHSATHFNTQEIDSSEVFNVMDINKAYYNCSKDKNFPRKLHKHHKGDFTYEFTQNNLGFYTIELLSELPDHLKLTKFEDGVVSSVKIKYLYENDVIFNITEGMYSVTEPIKIDISGGYELDNKINGVPFYSYLAGNFCRSNNELIFSIDTDEQWGMHVASLAKKIGYIVHQMDTNFETKICTYQIIKENKYEPYNFYHWYVFIIDYMWCEMLDQLKKMNKKDIYRLGIDSIYYKNNYEIPEGWKQEEPRKIKFFRDSSSNYILPHKYESNACDSKYVREYNGPEVHIGPGGYGKTHRLKNNYGLIDSCYVALSYHQIRKNNMRSCVLTRLLGKNCERYHKILPANLIIDECTQLTQYDKNLILKMFPDTCIYFAGDIDKNDVIYQTPAFTGKQFTVESLNIVDNYNIDWRTEDPKLIKLKKIIRERINEPFRKIKSRKKTIDFSVNDYYLAFTHKECDRFNKLMIESNPTVKRYVVQQSTKNSSKGDISWGKKLPNSIEQYTSTIHQIQGDTIKDGKIYIQQDRINDNRLFYVAISRAVTYDQLVFI